jgi:hypothetical protein
VSFFIDQLLGTSNNNPSRERLVSVPRPRVGAQSNASSPLWTTLDLMQTLPVIPRLAAPDRRSPQHVSSPSPKIPATLTEEIYSQTRRARTLTGLGRTLFFFFFLHWQYHHPLSPRQSRKSRRIQEVSYGNFRCERPWRVEMLLGVHILRDCPNRELWPCQDSCIE